MLLLDLDRVLSADERELASRLGEEAQAGGEPSSSPLPDAVPDVASQPS